MIFQAEFLKLGESGASDMKEELVRLLHMALLKTNTLRSS
jgi:hypothetical protein